jgi:hypothetical protein
LLLRCHAAMPLLAVVAVVVTALHASTTSAPLDIHLTTSGSDSNDGSSAAQALATVPAAQAAVRKALATGQKAVTVRIGPGNYVLNQTLNLSAADSGPAGSTVLWTATASSTTAARRPSAVAPATFSGGQPIKFAADSDSGLWKADVSELPAKAVAYGRQLWVNDRRAARSTEPGSYDCQKGLHSPCFQSKTVWGAAAWEVTNTTVRIVGAQAAARARSWPNSGAGVEFVWTGVSEGSWAESRCQVQRVLDATPTSAAAGAVEVNMSQPCLHCFATFWGTRLGHTVAPAPTAIEAIGKDHLNVGEW